MLILRRTPDLTLRTIAVTSNTMRRNYTKDYSSSDDEKDNKKQSTKEPAQEEETAAAKLNRLLASMKTDDPYTPSSKTTATENMTLPGNLNKKRREAFKEDKANKDVFTAVKRVASMLNDQQQQKQTESELLAKLLGHNTTTTAESQDDDNKKTKSDKKAGGGKPESEMSLSELIVGMKIDRNPQRDTQTSRGDYVRRTLAAARGQQQQQTQRRDGNQYKRSAQQQQNVKREAETFTGSVNLFGAEPLGIFKDIKDLQSSPDILTTWSKLNQHDLQLQVTHPPSNYFEKIALWTEKGKVWRFPIDNQQDWHVEETSVDFSEHIFLEQHLENWCPTKGPIRHFMELVCVGLSKNPYLTAREKKDHILWYRDYFESKRDLLKDYMQQQQQKQETKPKQLKQ